MTEVDVCLLLEGTYPFVRGGVSSWVHQIISGLPELRFAVVFLGGRRADYAEPRYELPANVLQLQTHYLEDAFKSTRPSTLRVPSRPFQQAQKLHQYLRQRAADAHLGSGFPDLPPFDSQPTAASFERLVDQVLTSLERPGGLCIRHFLFGAESWEYVREQYLERAPEDASFVDYFWALRLIHGPIFQLARIADQLPEARAYHTVSTGYAGLLGAFAERRRRRPLILSEHGIYTKERRIDLNQAEWHDAEGLGNAESRNQKLRELWIRSFESMGRLVYRSANPIISLYGANQQRQHQDGADPAKTRIIANGIDLERFSQAFDARTAERPRVVAMIGRVVPIKDVKTFVRAIGVLRCRVPEAVGWIVGGTEEGAGYGEECEALAQSLGLSEALRFLGHQNIVELLPQIGLLMLSSISEAQPLVLLEGFAAGVPSITTDVGSCRELIEGLTAEDRSLGSAGRVVSFADHEALGEAAAELLGDDALWRKCQAAAFARAHRYYGQEAMLMAYRGLYREAMEGPWQASASA